jgi:hypothetical protein
MKCLVKNILPGPIKFAAFSLEYKEEKQVEYTETLRYYVSMGYIRLLDMYPETESAPVFKKKKVDNN